MSNNGGKPRANIPTLEEALRKFARERGLGPKKNEASGSNVHYADFANRREDLKAENADELAPERLAAIEGFFDEKSGDSAQIVPIIDGIPQTLQQLELLAAAEEAFRKDVADLAEGRLDADEDDESIPTAGRVANPNRRRDFAISAAGAALMIFAAIWLTRSPQLRQKVPALMSQNIATQPLKSGADIDAGDSITTLVILADSDVIPSARKRVKPSELEINIKDELRSRAFPDIGVSVGARGDTYLAGQVYSVDEAEKIREVVKQVPGVRRAHFLHPDVISADGPAYFGVTTGSAPDVWGAKVEAVFIGSPADKAGLQPGDVISAFDGQTIPDGSALNSLVAGYHPGQRVELRVWHNGQPEYLVARMSEMTTMAAR
ncbi:MAG: PDZ domain-containing protein [Candidatus Binatus sp.]|uniref:PDZ domain-containing protein n=1 Tax=Candidatus Binatus sp. TaxID=2811406 RepID=UPI002723E814|nr:PDZ domain-containing protein [Candidatus Binatus sp.]MDO8431532.1 PDZ domain-containing protein [Candidatus Binatus sp.]